MIYVPLYDTLGEPAIVHIINQSMLGNEQLDSFLLWFSASLRTVFVDKPENILALLKIAKQVPTLKRIVLTKKLPDEKETEIRNKAQELNIEIVLFNQLRVSEKNLLTWVFNLFSYQSTGLSKPVPHHVSTSYLYEYQQ